ncbi:MAG TPA: hypothetical protein VMM92_09405 [Thermoanaerobaculia bacterium]|nr:hypothetical protein [Thermoanaerobaculia bacterium]
MMERWRRLYWLTSVLYLTVITASPAGSGTAPTPDLSGTWTLNEEQSQDPRAVMREAMQNQHQGMGGGGRRGGRGGGGGGGFPGGGGGGGGRGRRSSDSDDSNSNGSQPSDEGEHKGPDPFKAIHDLKISTAGNQLTVAAVDGTDSKVYFTDGRKVSEDKEGVGTIKTQAQWKDGALEVVTKLPKGRKKTEIYEITHDRKHLYVLTTLEGYGRMPDVTFRRVYDPPAPPPQPTEAAPTAPTTSAAPGLRQDDAVIEEDF